MHCTSFQKISNCCNKRKLHACFFVFYTRLVAGRKKVVEHTIKGSILFIYLTNLIHVYEMYMDMSA